MDVTQSHDPWAPEGSKPEAAPDEKPTETDPQSAETDAVDHGDAPDVSADAVGSEAQDAPLVSDSATYVGIHGTDVTPDGEEQPDEVTETVSLDPTPPAASDGPTETESPEAVYDAEHDAAFAEAEAAGTVTTLPPAEPEITDERGIDATDDDEDAEPETPSTSEEAH